MIRVLTALLLVVPLSASAGMLAGSRFDHTSTFGLLSGLRVSGGEAPLFQLGLEATHNRKVYADVFYAGAFAQAEGVAFRRWRFALGPQFSFLLAGLEMGAAIETAGLGRPSTIEAQFAPYFSFVIGSLACRISIPIDTLERTTAALPSPSVTLVLTFKFPWIDKYPFEDRSPPPAPPPRARPAPMPPPPGPVEPPVPPVEPAPVEETPQPPAPNEI